MKEVKLWIHDNRLYQKPHYIWDKDAENYISEWKDSVFSIAKKANESHFVYATKVYKDGELIEINLYSIALNDTEFNKRTDNVYLTEQEKGNTVWFGAWHKGTSY